MAPLPWSKSRCKVLRLGNKISEEWKKLTALLRWSSNVAQLWCRISPKLIRNKWTLFRRVMWLTFKVRWRRLLVRRTATPVMTSIGRARMTVPRTLLSLNPSRWCLQRHSSKLTTTSTAITMKLRWGSPPKWLSVNKSRVEAVKKSVITNSSRVSPASSPKRRLRVARSTTNCPWSPPVSQMKDFLAITRITRPWSVPQIIWLHRETLWILARMSTMKLTLSQQKCWWSFATKRVTTQGWSFPHLGSTRAPQPLNSLRQRKSYKPNSFHSKSRLSRLTYSRTSSL